MPARQPSLQPGAPTKHSAIGLHFPGLKLLVESSDPGRLRGSFLHVLGQFAVATTGADFTLHAIGDQMSVTDASGGRLDPATLGVDEAGISLEEAALRTYISCCADRLLLHAAGLAKDDRVIILAAPSTHGKTTLSLALLALGWRFMSDEIVPISLDTVRAAPFPRALHIRRGSLAVLEQQNLLPALTEAVLLRHDASGLIYGIPLQPVAHDARLPIAALVFPGYVAGTQAAPVLLPPGVTTGRILQQTLNGGTLAHRAFVYSVALARRVPSYQLAVDELRLAVAALESLLP